MSSHRRPLAPDSSPKMIVPQAVRWAGSHEFGPVTMFVTAPVARSTRWTVGLPRFAVVVELISLQMIAWVGFSSSGHNAIMAFSPTRSDATPTVESLCGFDAAGARRIRFAGRARIERVAKAEQRFRLCREAVLVRSARVGRVQRNRSRRRSPRSRVQRLRGGGDEELGVTTMAVQPWLPPGGFPVTGGATSRVGVLVASYARMMRGRGKRHMSSRRQIVNARRAGPSTPPFQRQPRGEVFRRHDRDDMREPRRGSGMIDASITWSPSIPWTCPRSSTTSPSAADGPIRHVPTTCGIE